MPSNTTTSGTTSRHLVTPLYRTSTHRNPGCLSLTARQRAQVSLCRVISMGGHAVNDWLAWPLLTQHQVLHWPEGGQASRDHIEITHKVEADGGEEGGNAVADVLHVCLV